MQGIEIISALAGLVGATSGHDKSEKTDAVVCMALAGLQDGDAASIITEIHNEKYTIAPDCATCQSPCGNTSDQDMSCLLEADDETKAAMLELLDTLKIVAEAYLQKGQPKDLPEAVYTGIAYLGYGLEAASYRRITEKLLAEGGPGTEQKFGQER